MRVHILTTIRRDGRTYPAGRKADLPEDILPPLYEIGALRDLTAAEIADEAALTGRTADGAESGAADAADGPPKETAAASAPPSARPRKPS